MEYPKVTIFKDLLDKTPHHITLSDALLRIKTGKSKKLCEQIRSETDKAKQSELKKKLPAVLFSGEFSARGDKNLVTHSGYAILDFDKCEVNHKKSQLILEPFIFACWESPSGNGVKALVRIKDTTKHREHLKSLFKYFPDADAVNINPERLCFESYDPNIHTNEESIIYTDYIIEEKPKVKEVKVTNENKIIESILKWLTNRGNTFQEGERNLFIYRLASACCRFGISESDCNCFCESNYSCSDFSKKEINKSVWSAYQKNIANSAEFKENILVEKAGKKEVEINTDLYNLEIKPQEVIYGESVKTDALELYNKGYENIESTGAIEIDEYFKFKKGEITLISGYGNYGKSIYMKYLMLLQVLLYGKKICIYSPEEFPAHEFYHDFVEIYFGCNCLPSNTSRPSMDSYIDAYNKISSHIFYVYPTKASSTPEYVKQVFLELIIKEKVDFCIIDPFNQLDNDYNSSSNVSKYLERVLGDISRFTIQNQICMVIIAHPKSPQKKDNDGNYPCPDVFDMNDGAMWNNKMDNILIFHKPLMQTDPENSLCEHWSKKIRRQKIVGKKGCVSFDYDRKKRRFVFGTTDYIQNYFDGVADKGNEYIMNLPYKDNELPIEPPF